MITSEEIESARTLPGCSDITIENCRPKLFAACQSLQKTIVLEGVNHLALVYQATDIVLAEAKRRANAPISEARKRELLAMSGFNPGQIEKASCNHG